MGKRDQVPRPPGGRPNVEKNKGGKRGARRGQKKNTFWKKKLPKKKKYSKEKKRKEKKRKENERWFLYKPKTDAF